jgi:hypothetical protein
MVGTDRMAALPRSRGRRELESVLRRREEPGTPPDA